MSDLDYLKGQWEEFRKWEEVEHEYLKDELKIIRENIDKINEFKWKLLGMASAVSFIVTGLTISAIQLYRAIKGA